MECTWNPSPIISAPTSSRSSTAPTASGLAPFSSSDSPVPVSPVTVPPIVKALVAQLTTTLVTLAVAVPLPLATAQVCPEGCAAMVTA